MGIRVENAAEKNKNYRLKLVFNSVKKILFCSVLISFVIFVFSINNSFADPCNDRINSVKDSIKIIEEELQKAITQVKSGNAQFPSHRLKEEVNSLQFNLIMLRQLKECHHLIPPNLNRIKELCKQLDNSLQKLLNDLQSIKQQKDDLKKEYGALNDAWLQSHEKYLKDWYKLSMSLVMNAVPGPGTAMSVAQILTIVFDNFMRPQGKLSNASYIIKYKDEVRDRAIRKFIQRHPGLTAKDLSNPKHIDGFILLCQTELLDTLKEKQEKAFEKYKELANDRPGLVNEIEKLKEIKKEFLKICEELSKIQLWKVVPKTPPSSPITPPSKPPPPTPPPDEESPPPESEPPDEESQPPATSFSVALDCPSSFELVPGDFVGRGCGIIVKGWDPNGGRVEVKVEYPKRSGIDIFPGDTSADPNQMHTAGVTDFHSQYVFSESIRANETAPQGITTVNITVTQKGVGSVRLTLQISVLQKGDTPSHYGIRPPVDMATGGGPDAKWCVWRYRTLYEPAECFHFAKAECYKYNNRRGYELVGQQMTWMQAEALMSRLSRYGGDAFGCLKALSASQSQEGSGGTSEEKDTDGDGTPDSKDGCPTDPNKTFPGICGCGTPDTDSDRDGTPDCHDKCKNDPNKTEPGVCGCGKSETDRDRDGTPDCIDGCPDDPDKTQPGYCGCGKPETDRDNDGTPDCVDGCPDDPDKTQPGYCGCGKPETDRDGDGTSDCIDRCPDDPDKTEPGECGCGIPDTDTNNNGIADCKESEKTGCKSDVDCPQGYVCNSDGMCVPPFDNGYDKFTTTLVQRSEDRSQDRADQEASDQTGTGGRDPFTSEDLAENLTSIQEDLGGKCRDDSQCPPGYICKHGVCTKKPGCTDNSDCPYGYQCRQGECIKKSGCISDANCPKDQICQDGKCVIKTECSSNADCSQGMICQNGKCVQKPACTSDADCPEGHICQNSKCILKVGCVSDNDCPKDHICQNGKCVLKTGCGSDTDCPKGQVCRNGECVNAGDDQKLSPTTILGKWTFSGHRKDGVGRRGGLNFKNDGSHAYSVIDDDGQSSGSGSGLWTLSGTTLSISFSGRMSTWTGKFSGNAKRFTLDTRSGTNHGVYNFNR